MLTREQCIDIMKNGVKAFPGIDKDGTDCLSGNLGRKHVPFYEWEPEVQDLAREIGPLNFVYCRPDGVFAGNLEREFHKHITYALHPDYIDPPAEPEYEYLEIRKEKTLAYPCREFYAVLNQLYLIHAESLVGFFCYADAEKKHLGKVFDAETCKYVVLRRTK